ncbi:MAG: ABC transporter permease [Eubacteriales bacterium]|nr:ABC transporter permease [Eubacteriales bacterium]
MSRVLFRRMALTNIRRNRKFYVPFLLTIMVTAAMFYNMCSVSKNPVLTEHGSVKAMLNFGVYIIGIFAVIFIFYTNSFLMKRRKREFGLYHILGLEKKHIADVLAWENVFLALTGITGGVALGILLDKLMFLTILKIFHFPVSIPWEIYPAAVKNTVMVFGTVFIVIFISDIRSIGKSSAIELLRSENTGEREPKTRLLLVGPGLICVAGGYYIAITVDNVQAAISLLFVAVLLVMAGTYCLFLAGSIAILKMLKKKKSYYYKTNHFVAVSGLIYRMKQNAVGLANICILSTGVLLVISTTVSMYAGMDDIVQGRFPRKISVTSYGSTEDESREIEQIAEQTSEELGIEITQCESWQDISISFVLKDNELSIDVNAADAILNMNDIAAVTIITAETYEKLGGEHLNLQGNEVAVYQGKGKLEETFQMLGEEYQIVKELEEFPISNKMQNIVPVWINMVISGRDVWEQIDRAQKAACDLPGEAEYHVDFDVEGTEKEEEQFCECFFAKLQENTKIGQFYSGCRSQFRKSAFQMYGGMLFLGIYLGTLFLMVTVLIIYYKQISEGYEDRNRYVIMKKVGMDKREVKHSIKSQILILFFMPLCTALVHCLAAFHLMTKILQAFYMTNVALFAGVTAAVAGVFTLVYILVYGITARSYYHIVS